MWFARADSGFVIGGLGRAEVETLRGVPMLLESTDPRVRNRLLPETYDEADAAAQWRRHSAPELERLFLSRAQLVRKDLAGLRQLDSADSWMLPIPDYHVNAWLASLNAARLALFVLNDLCAEQMEREGGGRSSRKQREALERIHFLAELQCVLLGDFGLGGEDEDAGEGGWSLGGLTILSDPDLGAFDDPPVRPRSRDGRDDAHDPEERDDPDELEDRDEGDGADDPPGDADDPGGPRGRRH